MCCHKYCARGRSSMFFALLRFVEIVSHSTSKKGFSALLWEGRLELAELRDLHGGDIVANGKVSYKRMALHFLGAHVGHVAHVLCYPLDMAAREPLCAFDCAVHRRPIAELYTVHFFFYCKATKREKKKNGHYYEYPRVCVQPQ